MGLRSATLEKTLIHLISILRHSKIGDIEGQSVLRVSGVQGIIVHTAHTYLLWGPYGSFLDLLA